VRRSLQAGWPQCQSAEKRHMTDPTSGFMVHSHTRWDGMGWTVLVTQCVNISIEIHWVTRASHRTPAQHVCEYTIRLFVVSSSVSRLMKEQASLPLSQLSDASANAHICLQTPNYIIRAAQLSWPHNRAKTATPCRNADAAASRPTWPARPRALGPWPVRP